MKARLQALRLGHGSWVLADQAVVSLGTFLTNIAVARVLPREEYGAYALMISVMFVMNGFHGSLVVYPLSVRGATAVPDALRRYAGESLLLTVGLGVLFAVPMVAVAVILSRSSLAPFLVVALLAWQAQETLRRALMAHLRHRAAVLGDALSYLAQGGLVWVLGQQGHLSLAVVFAVMAFTSCLGAIIQAIQIKVWFGNRAALDQHAREGWRLGRWLLLSSLLSTFPLQAIPWALAAAHGTGEAAALQAATNILGVSHPVLFSIGNVLIPAVARARRGGGAAAGRRVALVYGAQGAVLLAPFFLLTMLVPRELLALFYGADSPYTELGNAVRLLVVAYSVAYVGTLLTGILNGLEQSRRVLFAQMASAAAAVGIGIPLAAYGGLLWAVSGRIVSEATNVAVSAWLLRAMGRSQMHDPTLRLVVTDPHERRT